MAKRSRGAAPLKAAQTSSSDRTGKCPAAAAERAIGGRMRQVKDRFLSFHTMLGPYSALNSHIGPRIEEYANLKRADPTLHL